MPKTVIKVCGITQAQDAKAALYYGANAIGLIFYHKSPRCVTLIQAKKITDKLSPLTPIVGVFVNPQLEDIQHTLAHVPLTHLQLHGEFEAAFYKKLPLPCIKVIQVAKASDISAQQPSSIHALLVDTQHASQYGGTGQTFDWHNRPTLNKPVILAGGLTPENVNFALATFKPNGVDVNSGVEIRPGIKDLDKLKQFILSVRSYEHTV